MASALGLRSPMCYVRVCIASKRLLRAQLENRASSWVVSCWVGLWLGWVVPREVGSSARRVRSRPPPLTPADGHCRCFWLRHRPRREPQEGDHTASRSVDHVARSMPASAWRTPWTVAKPKTPMVAVRWRERRRSRPHHSRRRPNLTRNNPTQPQPNPTRNNPTESTILLLGPRAPPCHPTR